MDTSSSSNSSASTEIVSLSLQPNNFTLRSDRLVNETIVLQLTARNAAGQAVALDMNTVVASTDNACVPATWLSTGIAVACNTTCRGGGGTDRAVIGAIAHLSSGKQVSTTAQAACTG